MALVKGSEATRMSDGAIVLDLGDLHREAQEVRDQAQEAAELMLADAGRRSAEMFEEVKRDGHAAGHTEGLAAGHAEGLAAGRAEALAEMTERLTALENGWVAALETFENHRRGMLADAREALVATAVALAEQIVLRVPEVDPSVVVDQARRALEHVTDPSKLTIRVNPEDEPLLKTSAPGLAAALAGCSEVRVEADAGVGRGGCVIEHAQGEIDADLRTQLRRMTEALIAGGDVG